ncbi:MAG: DUF2218 domain-containing protein [Pseudomonadota bacterium]
MLTESSQLVAPKARKYMTMLSRHFSRKVNVAMCSDQSIVNFPMGDCVMTVLDDELNFRCEAENREALDRMKGVIDGHIHLLKEVRGTELEWIAVS